MVLRNMTGQKDKREYWVKVKEIHMITMKVKAKSKADAVILVENGEGVMMDSCEYIETLESDTWSVYDPDKERRRLKHA
jgi:hypothetical protein